MKIVVLAGGLSPERDVSLVSGAGICKTLRERGHKAILLDVFLGLPSFEEPIASAFLIPDGNLSIADGIKNTEPDLNAIKASRKDQSPSFFGPHVIELCQMADVVFVGLHGDVGENGKIQATFDLLGIRYTGPGYLGCALSMDKDVSKQVFASAGIPCPRGIHLKNTDQILPLSASELSFPVVVKPCSGGSSVGVSIVEKEEDYQKALQAAFVYEEAVLVEEFIKGREFTVGVLDDTALPVIEIVPKSGFFDYKNKYQDGCTEEICPAPIADDLAKQMQALALKAHQALKLSVYSRADFLVKDDGSIYCLEVNSLPGMTSASLLPKEAAVYGLSYGELCEWIIQKSLERF